MNESTFEGYALRQLDEAAACGDGPLWGRCGFRPTDGLWVGLYAEQLAHWLVGFAAPSFTLLPFSEVTGNQTRALRALLGAVGLECKATATPLPQTNQKTPGDRQRPAAVTMFERFRVKNCYRRAW